MRPPGYDEAVSAAGVLDLWQDGWLRLSGKDTKPYLHRMVSCHVEKLPAGKGRRGLLLNVKGHVEADVSVLATGDEEVFVQVPAAAREKVAATLERYIIMDEVAFEDATELHALMTVQGPKAAAVVGEALGGAVPALADELDNAEMPLPGEGRARVVRRDRTGLGGTDVIVPRARALEVHDRLLAAARAHGGALCSPEALDALRLEAGIALFGRDFGDENLPQEARLDELGIVAFDKCYIGQEVVSRLHFRGHANKLLSGLLLETAPPPGAKLEKDGKDVGRVTSAAFSPARGRPIGLGYVRREHAQPGTELALVADGARSRADVVELRAGK